MHFSLRSNAPVICSVKPIKLKSTHGGSIMNSKEILYLASETLYRLGNSTSPLLSKMRPDDINIIDVNGVKMVVANHKGVSLYNKEGLNLVPLTGWVWEIKANTNLPIGLRLVKDKDPLGHYTLSPIRNMSVHEFLGLLDQVAIHCKKVYKKQA